MREYTLEEFITEHGEWIAQEYGINPENVYNLYYSNVEFALGIIPHFRIGNQKAREEQIRVAFGVEQKHWVVMKKCFRELQEALGADKSYAKLKANMAIWKGVHNTDYQNAKMIEMLNLKYDDEFKKDKEEKEQQKVEINITFDDASNDEGVLEKEFSRDE